MNVFTLTAAGLVALGVPLAAPWLSQEPTQDAHASTTLAPIELHALRSTFAPPAAAATNSAAAAVLYATSTGALNVASAPQPVQDSLFAPFQSGAFASTQDGPADDAAREIAELQARIAVLQAEVAALSAHQAHGASAGAFDGATLDARLHEQARAAFESALVDQRISQARADVLLEQSRLSQTEAIEQRAAAESRVAQALLLESAAQERSRNDRQVEGERRRADREAERAHQAAQQAEAHRLAEMEHEQRRRALEERHAQHADALATLEARIAEHEAAMAAIDAEFANAELSPRRQERLEERRVELQERVEGLYEEIDEEYEVLEEARAEFEELQWSDEAAPAYDGEQFEALRGLGYVGEDAIAALGYVDTENVDWITNGDADECDECEVDAFGALSISEPSLMSALTEEWLAQVGAGFGDLAVIGRPAQGRDAVVPRSSNGDVIVNVHGGGDGRDAEIVDLLREIRDEVRALRADLRSLHGATPPVPEAPMRRRGEMGLRMTPPVDREPDFAFGFVDSGAEGALPPGIDTFVPSGPGAPSGFGSGTFAASSTAPADPFAPDFLPSSASAPPR